MAEAETGRGNDWTEEEVRLTVCDYFDMLQAELSCEPYVKADHCRRLLQHLSGRSHQAIEYKHANIRYAPVADRVKHGIRLHAVLDHRAIALAAQAIAAADKAFNEAEYDEALGKYRSASEIKPGETYPGEKISEINRILKDIAKAEAIQQQYDQAIARADELAGSSKYEEALAEYKAAQVLKPDEDYPADKIREMNAIIEDIARKEEIQRKYDMAVSSGDSLLDAGQFRAAITSFKAATELKPDEQYPKGRILESQRRLDEIAAAETLEKEYNEAVALADSYVDQALYESAINNYKKALELKPEEQ